jgi:hypothetical protein
MGTEEKLIARKDIYFLLGYQEVGGVIVVSAHKFLVVLVPRKVTVNHSLGTLVFVKFKNIGAL